jgi:2-polyprenyl-6-methoxyphenol hydroxylase-like FAD-dependent oxidoreductase
VDRAIDHFPRDRSDPAKPDEIAVHARRHAEIVGAGFAGLTAAAALAQRGWSVRVHERATDLRTTGAGIFLFENGLRVLNAVGALQQAIAGAHLAVIRETRNARNQVVSTFPFTSDGRRTYVVVRQQLMEAIADAARRAGAEILAGSEAIAADPDGIVVLKDGRTLRADLVVVADGVNSRLRDGLGLLKLRKRLGDGGIRMLIHRRAEEADSEDGQKIIEYWSGRRRIIHAPCSRDWLYLALTTTLDDEDGKALPLCQSSWRRSFPYLAPLFKRIGDEGRWDPFEVVKLTSWSRGRVAVVGDAAHAQAPNLGQGGGCAMMNALGLAVALAETLEVEPALTHWERRERPLTEHTQRISSLYGAVTTWPDTLRSLALGVATRSHWLLEQRMRAANHNPTGT